MPHNTCNPAHHATSNPRYHNPTSKHRTNNLYTVGNPAPHSLSTADPRASPCTPPPHSRRQTKKYLRCLTYHTIRPRAPRTKMYNQQPAPRRKMKWPGVRHIHVSRTRTPTSQPLRRSTARRASSECIAIGSSRGTCTRHCRTCTLRSWPSGSVSGSSEN